MNKDYPWINEGGIDYVEVNNLVNPPNPANAGKVVGVGEDGKAVLVEGGGGTGGLPEVTDADDGKVLTVDGGEWTAVMPDRIILEGEIDENDQLALPMTYNEIFSALNQKKQVIILIPPMAEGYSWVHVPALNAFTDTELYIIALCSQNSSLVTPDPDSNTFTLN